MSGGREEPLRPRDVQQLLFVLAASAAICVGAAVAGVVELIRKR